MSIANSLAFSPGPEEPTPIRGNSVLPASRETFSLQTADGYRLVGELALPVSGPIEGTLVTLHPLPTHGGSSDSHIFRKAANRLPALAQMAVVRFNTRGTRSSLGVSEGHFDEGESEMEDVRAVADFVHRRRLPNRWLVGWSFGTELALKYGLCKGVREAFEGAILLSPPLKRAGEADLKRWAASKKPLVAFVPEFDDFLRPEQARERFACIQHLDLVAAAGAKHLWVGEKHTSWLLDKICSVVLGRQVNLPQQWPIVDPDVR